MEKEHLLDLRVELRVKFFTNSVGLEWHFKFSVFLIESESKEMDRLHQ